MQFLHSQTLVVSLFISLLSLFPCQSSAANQEVVLFKAHHCPELLERPWAGEEKKSNHMGGGSLGRQAWSLPLTGCGTRMSPSFLGLWVLWSNKDVRRPFKIQRFQSPISWRSPASTVLILPCAPRVWFIGVRVGRGLGLAVTLPPTRRQAATSSTPC